MGTVAAVHPALVLRWEGIETRGSIVPSELREMAISLPESSRSFPLAGTRCRHVSINVLLSRDRAFKAAHM